jgi:peptidoglycan/LPS O-acetylase OafA/YrhL
LTFTLNGVGSVEGIGHLWYVSTAMQLYLLMPFIFLLLRKIPDKVNVFWLVFALVAALGLGLRFLFLRLGLDWYSCVYTLSLMNLDIVAIGMLVAKMKSSKTKNALGGHHKPWFIVSVVFFIALSLLNCYLYYVGNDICFRIYRYVFPSAYTIASAMLILSSPSNARLKAGACSVVVKIVDKISAFCSKYSYAIYICHIAVFRYVSQILQATSWFLNLATAIQFLLFMVISFVVTVLIAMIFSKLTVSKRAPSGSKN